MSDVIVVGGGIIGLATAEKLIHEGHSVKLIDPNVPGSQTSTGNAGLIANFANTPLANSDTLKLLPRNLLDSQSGLSLDPLYLKDMYKFGFHFLKAALSKNFKFNQRVLTEILRISVDSHVEMTERTSGGHLVKQKGCLHLFKNSTMSADKIESIVKSRQVAGINCDTATSDDVNSLEPDVSLDGVQGGILYKDTMHLLSPQDYSDQIFSHLLKQSRFEYLSEKVERVDQVDGKVDVLLSNSEISSDYVVLCGGLNNTALLANLGVTAPVISERGYNVDLANSDIVLNRPVGLVNKYFFATPMKKGIRLAGTTEFASQNKAENVNRFNFLEKWGGELFGQKVTRCSEWMGVRHSSPDSLPVISPVPNNKRIIVSYGHGHLGLTMAAFTGLMVAKHINQSAAGSLADKLSVGRF
jgi:glycine/D-amino acid oxidase-like deaminating enzyme